MRSASSHAVILLQRCYSCSQPNWRDVYLFRHHPLGAGRSSRTPCGGGLEGLAPKGSSNKNRGDLDQALAAWRTQYGLNQSLPAQYWRWLRNLRHPGIWQLLQRQSARSGAKIADDSDHHPAQYGGHLW